MSFYIPDHSLRQKAKISFFPETAYDFPEKKISVCLSMSKND